MGVMDIVQTADTVKVLEASEGQNLKKCLHAKVRKKGKIATEKEEENTEV